MKERFRSGGDGSGHMLTVGLRGRLIGFRGSVAALGQHLASVDARRSCDRPVRAHFGPISFALNLKDCAFFLSQMPNFKSSTTSSSASYAMVMICWPQGVHSCIAHAVYLLHRTRVLWAALWTSTTGRAWFPRLQEHPGLCRPVTRTFRMQATVSQSLQAHPHLLFYSSRRRTLRSCQYREMRMRANVQASLGTCLGAALRMAAGLEAKVGVGVGVGHGA